MMIRAYSESYLNDAKQNLAECMDYGIKACRIEPDFFSAIFLQSGYAEQFERGNPSVVAGMSGVELARKVISYAYPEYSFLDYAFSEERSDMYWAGWVLAEFQWTTCKRFKDIFSKVPLSEIVDMYKLYHEIDVLRFIEDLSEKLLGIEKDTHLKIIRESRGISQSDLARLSGVKLRSIQLYEQRVNDIDRAQAGTLYKLSRVLGCTVEDLLESPER